MKHSTITNMEITKSFKTTPNKN